MTIRKNKSEVLNIREMVRDEVNRAMKSHKQNHSNDLYKGFYSKAKNQILSDLMRTQVNAIFKTGFERSVARQISKIFSNL